MCYDSNEYMKQNKTYDICKADDDDVEIAFLDTNAVGAKAVADATKNDVTAIENFMMMMMMTIQ